MAIELHHLHPGHDDELSRLKARIAELEKENESLKYSVATLETDLAMSQRWRKCSEEMPEEDDCVLFSDGKYIYIGSWTTWDGGCSDYSYETRSGWVESGSENDYDFNEIKYWMPLPSAPKEDN